MRVVKNVNIFILSNGVCKKMLLPYVEIFVSLSLEGVDSSEILLVYVVGVVD
jgi:hypothetical protein